MRLIDVKHFPEMEFSLYFMASVPEDEETPEPGTKEANNYLWTLKGTCLELTQ